MTPAKGQLTSRGWYLAGGMVVMTLVAFLFGVEEFYALAASSGAALLSAAVWLRRRRYIGFDATVEITPKRAAAGGRAGAQFVLVNSGQLRVPPISVSIPIWQDYAEQSDIGGGPGAPAVNSPLFCLPGLATAAQVEATFRLPTTRRGLLLVGPAVITVSDPLGLCEKSWTSSAEQHFVVHPTVHPLSVLPQLAAATRPGMAKHHSPAHRGEELHALRDYQDGDDLRQVHWRATARWDRLMVRLDEADRGCLVCVGLDLRADHLSSESLERGVEAAASIACMVLAQPAGELRLTTTMGQRWGPGHGNTSRCEVLDLLAVVDAHREPPALPLFGGRAEVAVLIAPTENAARELLAHESTAALRSIVVVLTDEVAMAGQPSVTVRHWGIPAPPVTLVHAAGGLKEAWAAAVGPGPLFQRVVAWAPTVAQPQLYSS
jgi:uncharacterized protein (DUF58 family)